MDVSACLDVGGTKLQAALINNEGTIFFKTIEPIDKRGGEYTGGQIIAKIKDVYDKSQYQEMNLSGIGIALPGQIKDGGKVWAPNISDWQSYPLEEKISQSIPSSWGPVVTISDRQGFAEGEYWLGRAKNTRNFVFIAIGTGIGAGIFINGTYYGGHRGLSGSMGWLTIKGRVHESPCSVNHLENYASGSGIINTTREILARFPEYSGQLADISEHELTARDIFKAYEEGDKAAQRIFDNVIEHWSGAIADCTSILDPQLIVLGGGLFGPASRFLSSLKCEVNKRLSPAQKGTVNITISLLGSEGVLFGIKRVILRKM